MEKLLLLLALYGVGGLIVIGGFTVSAIRHPEVRQTAFENGVPAGVGLILLTGLIWPMFVWSATRQD